jgi:hypothetical protein
LPLPLRNRLAELALGAFEPGEGRATLRALARACDPHGSAVDEADAGRLLALGWFERVAPDRVRLLGAFRAHGPGLAERASRAASAVGDWRDRAAGGIAPLLDRAAALASHGLFFEIHELLEPVWFRATEPVRTALQGLIQVAVAFHHLETGNRDGARSLLALGLAKLGETGAALPLDTSGWLDDLRATLAALATGSAPPPSPSWPLPVSVACVSDLPKGGEEARWRCS